MQATIAQTTQESPGAATVPAPPARGTIVITNPDGTQQTLPLPMTGAEVNALKAQRNELSNQLISAANRRHELATQLRSAAPGADRIGLEQRIGVLDKRIVQLESDIASTGRQLSSAPLDVIGSAKAAENAGDIPDNVAALSGAFIGVVLFPLTIVLARNLWKRGTRMSKAPLPQLAGADQRLERLEQGMDAIAIEIERVAEGQRFVTRLLSEGQAGQSVSINRSMERPSTS